MIEAGRRSLRRAVRSRLLLTPFIGVLAGCSGESAVSVPAEAKASPVAAATPSKAKPSPRMPRGPDAANALRGAEKSR